MLARRITIALLGCAAAQLRAQSHCAQQAVPVIVGSEWEHYLRVAQVVGRVGAQPWTIRDFGPKQWTDLQPRDSTLPWARIDPGFSHATCLGRGRFVVLPSRVRLIHNSGFPLGQNDGAIWAGRGLTAAAEVGASASFGAVTVVLAPIMFSSQNAAFRIAPTGLTGNRAFGDWRNIDHIDLPQRFGNRPYTAFDPGQSGIRLDIGGAAIGVSTANQFWGPATDHPIILGNNAAGFPHLFVGTARPLPIWRFGRIHTRTFWGRLDQSPYSPLADSGVTRLASGIAAVFQPSVFPGLEIGGARFFHVLQDRFTLNRRELLRPLGALLAVGRARQIGSASGDEPAENQLASVFLRFTFPDDVFEVYGEFGREDRNWDLREFWLMPDHDAAYLLGLRKVWRRAGDLVGLRAEVLNSRVSHLAHASSQVPWYVHSTIRQGHTNKGQALGSVAAYGGGASVLALDRYTDRGRLTLSWERLQLGDSRQFRAPDLLRNDVAHIWRANSLRFGRRADVELGVAAVYEINRYLEKDAFSLQTTVSVVPGAHTRAKR